MQRLSQRQRNGINRSGRKWINGVSYLTGKHCIPLFWQMDSIIMVQCRVFYITGFPQTQGNQGNQGNQGKLTFSLENSGNFIFSQGNQGKFLCSFKKKFLCQKYWLITIYKYNRKLRPQFTWSHTHTHLFQWEVLTNLWGMVSELFVRDLHDRTWKIRKSLG